MKCIALISHGPNWVVGKTVYQQGPAVDAHVIAMRERFDQGTLLLGGPYISGRGGIAILDVSDEQSARELMDADPAVIAGVFTYRLEPTIAYFDAFSGVRTTNDVATLEQSR